MVARGPGDRQHVVERHRQVGQDDADQRLPRRLARTGGVSAAVAAVAFAAARFAHFAVHLPRHPQQQHAAGQGQPDNREQLRGKIGKQDTQRGGETMPSMITRRRWSAGSAAAAMPTTTALSPASTTSMMTTESSAPS